MDKTKFYVLIILVFTILFSACNFQKDLQKSDPLIDVISVFLNHK